MTAMAAMNFPPLPNLTFAGVLFPLKSLNFIPPNWLRSGAGLDIVHNAVSKWAHDGEIKATPQECVDRNSWLQNP
jgi:hypothetical protein